MRRNHCLLCLILITIAFIAPNPASAQADTPASLRQKISQLERENETLRAELKSLQSRFGELRRELSSLRRALAATSNTFRQTNPGAPTAGSPAAKPRAPAVSLLREPLASPDALYVSLVLDYREQIGEMNFDDDTTEQAARRRVRGWTKAAGERLSGQTQWITRLDLLDSAVDRKQHNVMVTILDPATMEAINAPLALVMPLKFYSRVKKAMETPVVTGASQETPLLWKLRVQMDAVPVFDPERMTPGPFNYPPYIGPFAGFGYSIQILGVGPITPDEVRQAFPEDDPDVNGKVER